VLANDGEAFDLVPSLPGSETTVAKAVGCPPGVDAELWTIHGGGHMDTFSAAFGPAVWRFLHGHPKPWRRWRPALCPDIQTRASCGHSPIEGGQSAEAFAAADSADGSRGGWREPDHIAEALAMALGVVVIRRTVPIPTSMIVGLRLPRDRARDTSTHGGGSRGHEERRRLDRKAQRRAGHKLISTTMLYVVEVENRGATFGQPFPPLPEVLLSATPLGQGLGQIRGDTSKAIEIK
jgi:hypothetical protein